MPRAPFHLDSIKRALAAAEGRELRQSALAQATDLSVTTLLAAVKPGLRSGELVDRREGRSVFYRLADHVEVEAEEEQDPGEFGACLWADGELDLYGVTELESGGVRVSAEGVRQLCRLLHGQGPEE